MPIPKEELSYICLYHSYRCIFDRLSDKELGEVICALMDYEKDGTMPVFEGSALGAFRGIMFQINRDKEKYQERCKGKGKGEKSGRN